MSSGIKKEFLAREQQGIVVVQRKYFLSCRKAFWENFFCVFY